MDISGLLYLFFFHPVWFWHVVWHRILNPSNFRKRNARLLPVHTLFELSLSEALQKLIPFNEQADCVMNEWKENNLDLSLPFTHKIPERFDASRELANLCYSIVRLTRPAVVVETGVARGATSASILKALDKNGKGRLYSIELPILLPNSRKEVGSMVPLGLRERWNLIFGPGTIEIPKLRRDISRVDIFVHDSEHSYSNQIAEFERVWPWLKEGGILISDDVDNNALFETFEKNHGTLILISQDEERKPRYLGILRKESEIKLFGKP